MTLRSKEIKRRWKWFRDGKARDQCAAERDGVSAATMSLKMYARAEAKHWSYSNHGLDCYGWLKDKR